MNPNTLTRGILALVASTLLATANAKADTFTGTLSQTRDLTFANIDGDGEFLYNAFDDTLGQLTAVNFHFQGLYSETLIVSPPSNTPLPRVGLIRTSISVSIGDVHDNVPVPDTLTPLTPNGTLIRVEFPATIDLAPTRFGLVRGGSADVRFSVGSRPLFAYDIYYGDSGVSGIGTLTYTFTPVPEPASLALLAGTVTAALGFRARKKP